MKLLFGLYLIKLGKASVTSGLGQDFARRVGSDLEDKVLECDAVYIEIQSRKECCVQL